MVISERAFAKLVALVENFARGLGCGGGYCPCFSSCYRKRYVSCEEALREFLAKEEKPLTEKKEALPYP